jgi:putative phosphoesterase
LNRPSRSRARIAVISDVHGNRRALEATFNDIDRRGADLVVDLGDSLYGPLDPTGTAELLMGREMAGVLGNEDRILLDRPAAGEGATLAYTRACLAPGHLDWLAGRAAVAAAFGELLCCHGTPERDDEYLLETVTEAGVRLRTSEELAVRLRDARESVVLCGHSHVPRAVALPGGRLIVNPGSVGLPAYRDDFPLAHAMEAGSPHARFALLERTAAGWRVEHVAVPYDWHAAAQEAADHGRPDWAEWLATGRASVGAGGTG